MQTARQKQHKNDICIRLYNKIAAFMFQFGQPPSIREMRILLDSSSNSMIHGYLKVLRKWGWIKTDPHKCRTLRLTRATELDMSRDMGRAVFGSVALTGLDANVSKEKAQRAVIVQTRRERQQTIDAMLDRRLKLRGQIEPYEGGNS